MKLERCLVVILGCVLGLLTMLGCAASRGATDKTTAAIQPQSQRVYPSSSEPLVKVVRYHSLQAGYRICALLTERGEAAAVGGSETGFVLAQVSEAVKVRAIIAEAIEREHLDAVIADK